MATPVMPEVTAGMRRNPVPTFGVEEEFLLLRADGEPACVAPQVLALLAGDPAIQPEWMTTTRRLLAHVG